MARFSHIIRAKQPLNARSTQRFILALLLVLVFGVVYRGRQVSVKMEEFVASTSVQETSEQPINSVELLAVKDNPQLDVNMSTMNDNDTERQQTPNSGDLIPDASDDNMSADPCIGRPQPAAIPPHISRPPSLYFLHIPKTAGTLMHHLVIAYGNKTKGLPCQYLYDGNRFLPHDYHLSVKPPPLFSNGSIEQQAVDAIIKRNRTEKLELLKNGACRTMRGHVTYRQREYMRQPIISITIVRHPLERFVSMYEFAMMMIRARPGRTGWDNLITGDLQADFRNSSSLLHQGFYHKNGTWIGYQNIGFSFHLYGVLHQLSGITPVFEGVGTPEQFRISNADELAEKAKDNICSTHILGTQSDMAATLDLFFKTVAPHSNWTDQEVTRAKSSSINRNRQKKSVSEENWSDTMRTVMQNRFQHETDVYNFALKVIAYRKQLTEQQ